MVVRFYFKCKFCSNNASNKSGVGLFVFCQNCDHMSSTVESLRYLSFSFFDYQLSQDVFQLATVLAHNFIHIYAIDLHTYIMSIE